MKPITHVRVRVAKINKQDVKIVIYKHAATQHSEIGADVSLEAFIALLSDEYGSPASTMTRASHAEKLLAAATKVISEMKRSTVAVAALDLSTL